MILLIGNTYNTGDYYTMNSNKNWHQNEFLNQELMISHRKLEIEQPFFEAIANGDINYVKENCKLGDFTNPEGMGLLSDNPLQNLRYHFVVTTALITRHCINSGMEQEKAYALSDFYIQSMDKLSSTQDIATLHDNMCIDMCTKMKTIHNSMILSKPIILCLDYIYNHIHTRITLGELANNLNISKSYLSRLFSKEMGISISEYILKIKVEKAANLLKFSEISIVDIANYLAFSSESHFIMVFKKQMNTTPHKYRMQNFRSTWLEK